MLISVKKNNTPHSVSSETLITKAFQTKELKFLKNHSA